MTATLLGSILSGGKEEHVPWGLKLIRNKMLSKWNSRAPLKYILLYSPLHPHPLQFFKVMQTCPLLQDVELDLQQSEPPCLGPTVSGDNHCQEITKKAGVSFQDYKAKNSTKYSTGCRIG